MIKQLSIIMCMLGVGHVVVAMTGIKVPASIVGMLLLTVLLRRRVVREEDVRPACRLIVGNLGFFFVPPGVALMVHYDIIMGDWMSIVVATVVSTAAVMIVTAGVHVAVSNFNRRMTGDGRAA